jgi:hypothetical protein
MYKLSLFLIISSLSCTVNADTLTWSWNAPTAREDSTPFDMTTEGAGYQIKFNGVLELDANGNPLLLSSGSNGIEKEFPAGDVCIEVATQDTIGRLGRFTDAVNNSTQTACKRVLAPPGEITNLEVQITITQ